MIPSDRCRCDARSDLTMRCILVVLCFSVCWITYLLLHAFRSADEASRSRLSPMADRDARASQTGVHLTSRQSRSFAATVAPHFKATAPTRPTTSHKAATQTSMHSAFTESDDGSSRVHVVCVGLHFLIQHTRAPGFQLTARRIKAGSRKLFSIRRSLSRMQDL